MKQLGSKGGGMSRVTSRNEAFTEIDTLQSKKLYKSKENNIFYQDEN